MNCVRAKHFGTFSHGVSVCEFVCIIRFSYSIIHYRKREKILGMYIYSMALVQLTYVGAGLDLITPRKCQQCSIETIRLRVWTHNAELNENRKKTRHVCIQLKSCDLIDFGVSVCVANTVWAISDVIYWFSLSCTHTDRARHIHLRLSREFASTFCLPPRHRVNSAPLTKCRKCKNSK